MGCFWSSAAGRTRVKPDLVMLQPPAPPAPRPPSARHVTAGEPQENAEGLRWNSYGQVPQAMIPDGCGKGFRGTPSNVRGTRLRTTARDVWDADV